jgi:hypothetical protein
MKCARNEACNCRPIGLGDNVVTTGTSERDPRRRPSPLPQGGQRPDSCSRATNAINAGRLPIGAPRPRRAARGSQRLPVGRIPLRNSDRAQATARAADSLMLGPGTDRSEVGIYQVRDHKIVRSQMFDADSAGVARLSERTATGRPGEGVAPYLLGGGQQEVWCWQNWKPATSYWLTAWSWPGVPIVWFADGVPSSPA